jgi:hypothetical protein
MWCHAGPTLVDRYHRFDGKSKFLIRSVSAIENKETAYSSETSVTWKAGEGGGQRCSPNFSLASAQQGPSHFTSSKKTRYPLYRSLYGPQGPVWMGAENIAPTEIRAPDRPARIELLYRPTTGRTSSGNTWENGAYSLLSTFHSVYPACELYCCGWHLHLSPLPKLMDMHLITDRVCTQNKLW